MNQARPISVNDRITSIDTVRGIAILGIFLVNLPAMLGIQPLDTRGYTQGVDAVFRFGYDLFIQTKFYSLFAFLFGLGFYLFMSRAEAKGSRMRSLFSMRLVVLFLLGCLHFLLLWYGDILHMYALVGFLLLFFYRQKASALFVWSIFLMALFMLFIWFAYSGDIDLDQTVLLEAPWFNGLEDYAQKVSQRYEMLSGIQILNVIIYIPELLGLFLLGLCAGKINFFQRVHEWKRGLRITQIVSLVVTILLFIPMFRYYFSHEVYVSEEIQKYIQLTGKTLFVFYLVSIVLLLENKRFRAKMEGFTYVGRMALTNYLLQTLVTVLLFSLFIPNTAGIPLWIGFIFCITIYLLQIMFSKWWLSQYAFGPMEWLWRCATYLQKQPLRLKQQTRERS
ncbi:DUF418 domain-containing protein [Brevibacillus laterosporus]|uniref:DUF418 domain-containing protein n=1 Tax=Brevibacillus laterosporus TaxID=1465 RepID=UPI0035A59AAB